MVGNKELGSKGLGWAAVEDRYEHGAEQASQEAGNLKTR